VCFSLPQGGALFLPDGHRTCDKRRRSSKEGYDSPGYAGTIWTCRNIDYIPNKELIRLVPAALLVVSSRNVKSRPRGWRCSSGQ